MVGELCLAQAEHNPDDGSDQILKKKSLKKVVKKFGGRI